VCRIGWIDPYESMTAARTAILALFLLLTASPSWGQEFYAYGGWVENTSTHDQTSGWGLAYMQGVGEHAMVSFTYSTKGISKIIIVTVMRFNSGDEPISLTGGSL
jgi:hypothetical protein